MFSLHLVTRYPIDDLPLRFVKSRSHESGLYRIKIEIILKYDQQRYTLSDYTDGTANLLVLFLPDDFRSPVVVIEIFNMNISSYQ